MACGLTVATTTTVGAAADLAIPVRTGALASPGHPSSLAEAMRVSAAPVDHADAQKSIARTIARMSVAVAAISLEELIQGLFAAAPWTP